MEAVDAEGEVRVYWSNRQERLVDELAEVLRRPAAGPFQPETVAVQSPGVARWLSKELSRRLGVCAGVRYPTPDALLREVVENALGDSATGLERWQPERLRWAIVDLLPSLIERPTFQRVAAYLGDSGAPGDDRRVQLAQRIAETFDRYIAFRPEMICRWAGGSDEGWQPELLRALAERIGAPTMAELTDELVRRCQGGDPALGEGIPRRICVYGISTLAPDQLRALSAVSRHVDVRLFVANPARVSVAGSERGDEVVVERLHPLVASMGRTRASFVRLLEDLDDEATSEVLFDEASDPEAGASMQQVLRSDALDARRRGGAGDLEPWAVSSHDRSLSVHACHGAMRQVEVLRDQLLAAFDEISDLEPRDVVVMAPDVEDFAPLIQAVFDEPVHGRQAIPYTIADRSFRRRCPVVDAFLRVLELAGSRVTASEVLDLLSLGPIGRRFGVSPEDLDTLTKWVSSAGVRWGIDADHRVRHGQPPYEENTWRFGLDRLLLGYAAPGHGRWLFEGTLPYDEIEGSTGVLLGSLSELCDRLFDALQALEGRPRPLSSWRAVLSKVLGDLIESTSTSAWEHELILDSLNELVDEAESVGASDSELDASVIGAILADRFFEGDEASGFMSGRVTFCGMVPVRNVPARVVAFLGMDDGAFPRSSTLASFDLTLESPRPADRSQRDDDRQHFLDALLSARDRVLILYSGQSIRDNQPLPPAAVVSELLDVLADAFVLEGVGGDSSAEERREAMLAQLVVRHPLHPFSPRGFGASDDDRLLTYAEGYLEGARVLLGDRHWPEPFLVEPLSEAPEPIVRLEELLSFYEQPVSAMFARRLGVRFFDEEVNLDDEEPLELSALERFNLTRPLLERRLHDEDLGRAYLTMRAAGVLPWGTPGRCAFDAADDLARPLADAVRRIRAGRDPLKPLSIDLVVGGSRVMGRVGSLWPEGVITHQASKVRAKHLLRLWINHLVLACSGVGGARRSWLVGRSDKGVGATVYELEPPRAAKDLLAKLLVFYRAGLSSPLVLFPETSKAYADVLLVAGDVDDPEARQRATEAATVAWRGSGYGDGRPGEGKALTLRRTFGRRLPFDATTSLPGGDGEEVSFYELALAVFGPLSDHLTEATR